MNLIFTKLPEPQIEKGGNYVTKEKRLVEGVLHKLEVESIAFIYVAELEQNRMILDVH